MIPDFKKKLKRKGKRKKEKEARRFVQEVCVKINCMWLSGVLSPFSFFLFFFFFDKLLAQVFLLPFPFSFNRKQKTKKETTF